MSLRGRLNQIQSKVNTTLNQGQVAITVMKEAGLGLIEEIEDGVEIGLVVKKENLGSLKKLVRSILFNEPVEEDLELPFWLRVKLREDDETP